MGERTPGVAGVHTPGAHGSACTDALVMQALMAVGTTQERLEFLG